MRRLLLGCVLALVLLLVWTAVVLLQARSDLLAARESLDRLRGELAGAGLDAGLSAAEVRLARASSRLADPGPALAAELPVLGRTPEAVRRTSDAVLASVRAARTLLATAEDGSLVRDGRVDLARLTAVAAESKARADDVARPLERLSDLDLALVPGFVAAGARDARAELDALPDQLREAGTALRGLQGFLGGNEPRHVLVVLQNNAELRGTGGLVSVFAEARAADGRLALGPFRDVEEVADPPESARRVPAPEDYRRLFGPLLADTTLWKNTNADPDVPRSSEVLAGVAAATLGSPPDGVLWLDVRAIAAVLGATSPAELPDGTQISGENAVELLLSESYTAVQDELAAQAQRRARLRSAGDAVAQRLLGGAPDVPRLADALTEAARGRHLALWSSDDEEQAGWVEAGLAGDVAARGGDLAGVVVHNLGGGDADGNKLDYYARRSLRVTVQVEDGSALVDREVELRNEAPTDELPGYVAGRVSPGTTNNLVLHVLPPGAQDVVLVRGDAVLEARPEPMGDSLVVQDVVSLAPGTSSVWRLQYRLPLEADVYALRVIPQALAVDAGVAIVVEAGDGTSLTVPAGSPLAGDDRRRALTAELGPTLELALDTRRPGVLTRAVDRVRRFWSEPVEVPW